MTEELYLSGDAIFMPLAYTNTCTLILIKNSFYLFFLGGGSCGGGGGILAYTLHSLLKHTLVCK